MKPIPAIVESHIDVDALEKRLVQAITGEADAERKAAAHEKLLTDSRAVATLRRIEIGKILLEARAAWPERGPASKGWGDFLRRVGMAESTAKLRMDQARDPEAFRQRLAKTSTSTDIDEDDGQTGPRIVPADREPGAAPFRALTEQDLVQALARLDPEARKRLLKPSANAHGGSGEEERGTWCTGEKWAKAVGPFDLDPFTNPRSKIASVTRCMLEDGGDGFGGVAPGSTPGLYLAAERLARGLADAGLQPPPRLISGQADAETRVWIQPPYDIVLDAIAHYGHTRFTALLRFSPDVEWFRRIWPLTCAVAIPLERMDFDPPPGIEKPKSSIPYPHALYYADERDITAEVRALCIIWRVDHETRPPLHIVR